MIVYIVQNEQDDIWFVSSNPVETLEELERGGKQVISVTCWSIDEEKESPLEDSRLKIVDNRHMKEIPIVQTDNIRDELTEDGNFVCNTNTPTYYKDSISSKDYSEFTTPTTE